MQPASRRSPKRKRDFERYRARTRNGETRADRHVADNRIKESVERMHTACNFTKISTAGITNRNNAQKRQAYTRYAKAEHSPPNVRSGGLTHRCGENKVAGSEKECEQHRADGNKSFAAGLFHFRSPKVFVMMSAVLRSNRLFTVSAGRHRDAGRRLKMQNRQ